MNFLSTDGITLDLDDETVTIYFVLFGVLGDNLGVNSLFGFTKSFCADYWCHFCRVLKYLAYKLTKEIPQYLRNSYNYIEDFKSKSYGVKNKCVFNFLPFFSNI